VRRFLGKGHYNIMQSIFSPAAWPRKAGERRGILMAAAVG
jgi:hypothetical protein